MKHLTGKERRIRQRSHFGDDRPPRASVFAFVTTAAINLNSAAMITLHVDVSNVVGLAAEATREDRHRCKRLGLVLIDAMELGWQQAKDRTW
jgi:hypothetical protein